MHRPGVEPAISRSQIQRPNHYTNRATQTQTQTGYGINSMPEFVILHLHETIRINCYFVKATDTISVIESSLTFLIKLNTQKVRSLFHQPNYLLSIDVISFKNTQYRFLYTVDFDDFCIFLASTKAYNAINQRCSITLLLRDISIHIDGVVEAADWSAIDSSANLSRPQTGVCFRC